MAGRIPRDFIDDIIARTDIVDIVDNRVRLKKAGKNYQACCPFHNEKTPSFTVSQDKQFYHCFGCGAHGNAISFIMEFDRLEFPEAIEELASFHGIDVPREKGQGQPDPNKRAQLEDDFALMEQVSRFFQQQLRQHPEKDKAVEYLKSRGLSGEIVKQFDIGFAPPEWDGALTVFGSTPEKQQQLLDLKLITENDKRRRYDFFRDRIMFPIRDKRGRVIGFGGRVLEEGGPKYLNSPETRIFHKGQELYGFYQAKQANRKLTRLMVVEGYMDVVALAQFGIQYAVAALGTSTTPEHVQMLFRAVPEVICCYDGDRAGREAAWRALENALPYLKDGVQMRFLFLPDGEDPDSLIRKIGREAFEQTLDNAVPLSEFFFENLTQRHHIGTQEGKAALRQEALGYIEQIKADNLSALLQEELDIKTRGHLASAQAVNRDMGSVKKFDSSRPVRTAISPVRKLIRLLLLRPQLATSNPEVNPQPLDEQLSQGLKILKKLHHFCMQNASAHTGLVLEYFRDDPDGKHLNKLLHADHDADETNPDKLYKDSFSRLIEQQLHARFEQLRVKNSLTEDEKREFMLLSQTKMTYTTE
ncbi:DNA primase [Aestuariibacter sp. AA17]|uniref:DNA primase n=1 Tax=Fluctibacter corallii TaxID=2984329 RepID=A0ABT3A420_9ALTE|nr:DNA primase [Aestuariibacter sp. AA17]MCV2883348.1 DNA primase [Aestuariibacter sp. AA17]